LATTTKLGWCPSIPDATTAPKSCISSLAVVIIGNPSWRARKGVNLFLTVFEEVRSRYGFVEKLRYMDRNPVARGLVPEAEQWPWSSYRSYAFVEEGPVRINP
jgi:hypothetical protein